MRRRSRSRSRERYSSGVSSSSSSRGPNPGNPSRNYPSHQNRHSSHSHSRSRSRSPSDDYRRRREARLERSSGRSSAWDQPAGSSSSASAGSLYEDRSSYRDGGRSYNGESGERRSRYNEQYSSHPGPFGGGNYPTNGPRMCGNGNERGYPPHPHPHSGFPSDGMPRNGQHNQSGPFPPFGPGGVGGGPPPGVGVGIGAGMGAVGGTMPRPMVVGQSGFPPPGMGGMPGAAAGGSEAERQSRRLYIGNLPRGVTETELMEFFDAAMRAAGVGVTKEHPCINAQISSKGFAFLEFARPEDATAGIGFDGIMLHDHALKVRRPSSFAGNTASDPMPYHGIAATNIPEGPEKIFMGGIPSEMTEEQVRELISTFGPLRGFNLVKDTKTNVSKGFCFFQYENPAHTDVAISRLHGRQVGDRELVVQRSARSEQQLDSDAQLRGSRGPVALHEGGARRAWDIMPPHTRPQEAAILKNKTALKFLDLRKRIPQTLAELGISNISDAGPPTRVLALHNMVNPSDLLDDRAYLDTFAEVRAFCVSCGGTPRSIHIPRPAPRPGAEAMKRMQLKELKEEEGRPPVKTWGVGKIFVEFDNAASAAVVLSALEGKYFDARKVLPAYFREDKYEAWDFTPDEAEEQAFQEAFTASTNSMTAQ